MTTYRADVNMYHETVDIPNPVYRQDYVLEALATAAITTFVTNFNLARAGTSMYKIPGSDSSYIDPKRVVVMDTVVYAI